jgi:hypothetical protein
VPKGKQKPPAKEEPKHAKKKEIPEEAIPIVDE